MKRLFYVLIGLMLFCGPNVFAAEHGGKEHGGKEQSVIEHGGKAVAEPSAGEIKKAMQDYVEKNSKKTGTFEIMDSVTGKKRNLKLQRVHERVGKTGNYYYSCADFKDTQSQELLDLDIDVEQKGGNLNVVDVRIHKVEGKERYTYDKNDNRIPAK